MRHKLLPLLLIAFTGLCSCDSSDVQTKPEAETPAAQQGKPYVVTDEVKLKLTEAEGAVTVVSSLIKSTQSRPTKDDLLLKIEPTLTTLASLDALLASTATAAPTDDIKEDLSAAQTAAKAAVSRLADAKVVLAKKQKPELSDDERSKVTSGVTQSQNELANIKRNLTTAGTRTVLVSSRAPTEAGGLFGWIVPGGIILGALILIALIVFGARLLLARTWAGLDSRLARVVKATIDGVNQQQKDLSARISTLSEGQTEIKSRLTDIQFELKSVGRLVRDAPDRAPAAPEVSLYPSPAHSTAVNFRSQYSITLRQSNATVLSSDLTFRKASWS